MAACNLSVIVSVTGDCTNSGLGAFTVNILGSNPPYFYQSISPTVDPIATPLPIGVTSFGQTNLSPGTYTFLIFDSCPGTPAQVYANVIISDGVCASLVGHSNTTCNSSNGSISASTNNELTSTDYFLYENTAGYITSANSINDIYVFQNLSAGTYYVTVNDGGGCTARTESCIIKESTPLDFGFYVVDNTGCNPTPTGKVFVTGITGFSPYIYQWSTGALTSNITGLTQGVYQLTLTDSTGCQTSKSAVVNLAPPITVVDYVPVSPTCTGSNGQITITIDGGTAPFNYVGSNGQSTITFDRTFSLTGLSSGVYTITVTDAGLCVQTFTYTLTAPNGFSILTVGIVNSTCNNTSGALSPISLVGGTPPFVYTLTYPSGNSIQQTVNGFSNQFQGLSAGTYTLTISNAACSVTNTYTINNTIKFDLNTTVTGETCDNNNGSVRITLTTGGTAPYTYYFQGQPTVTTSQTAYTFNNLSSGIYTIDVSDGTNCTQSETVVVPNTPSVDFALVSTNATNINNGQIQTYITDGQPPYTLTWSNNVNGQTGLTLTNLSAGTYSLTIVDDNDCELTRTVTIYGFNTYGTYGLYEYCESTIDYNGITIQKKIPQMYSEGFYDLVLDETNCILNNAVFYSQVTLAGVSAQTEFYTSNSLGDYPTDNQWYDAIRDALLSFPVIGNVIILPLENRITIQTNCSELSLSLDNSEVTVSLKISYDISCVCGITPPTPGVVIKECDMIYIQPSNEIYSYEFSSDTSNLLTISAYTFNSPSITFSSSKLWLYSVSTNTSSIQEYDIQLSGFTAVLNRTLNVGFEMGDAIGVRTNTKLITTDTSTQTSYNNYGTTPGYGDYFVELNISTNTPSITNKSLLPIGRHVIGSIVFNSDYSQMISLQINDDFDYFLVIHETSNYNQLIQYQLTSIAGNPSGLFVDSGNVYLLTDVANIYEIGTTFPYSQTLNTTIAGAGITNSIDQVTSCFTEQFSICEIGCGDTVNVLESTSSQNGIFETYINVGSGVGVVEVTFTNLLSTTDTLGQRYQLEWNNTILADSLFVYNVFNDTNVTNTVNQVTGTSSSNDFVNKFLYCEGNGNALSLGASNSNWLTNGERLGRSYGGINVIADENIPRSTITPGQLGVVLNYPTPASPSSDPNIKLQITKTSASPNIVKVIVYTRIKGVFTFQVTQCP